MTVRVTTWGRPAAVAGGLLLTGSAVLGGAPSDSPAEPEGSISEEAVQQAQQVGDAPPAADYVGEVQVVRDVGRRSARAASEQVLRGTVFDDVDRDSSWQRSEDGVAGVVVSNGRDVVTTGEDGTYELPAYDGMTVFITKPAGYDVPVDEQNIAQFHYHHSPAGSPPLRFGGLPPSGPLPSAVNFPVSESQTEPEADEAFRCAMLGDVQTYSGAEIGHARNGVIRDLAARDDVGACGVLMLGDVAGDDLGLYPRLKEVLSVLDTPVRAVPGNHDIDVDSTDPDHSFDTYKREIGPEYYSYDIGQVHVVGLNNVRYPCTPEVDDADGEHEFCADPAGAPTYNGVVGPEQLAWLEQDLAHVPQDHLVVIASHIPLVSFADSTSTQHQTDDVDDLYALLEDRPALSLSGHTHSLEVMETGDHYAGWRDAVGVGPLPFPHVVAGAASGDWYSGDLDVDGLPMALQRDGAVPGYLTYDFRGAEHVETFHGRGRPSDEQMSLSVSSPTWREWFTVLDEWRRSAEAGGDVPPPLNVNDLGDRNLVTTDDLARDSYLMTNLWAGTTSSQVTVQVDDREPVTATRTQQARGEDVRSGAAVADPYAATRQLQVARHGFESTSGDEDAQGFELYRGSQFGPGPAQPGLNVADRSHHLWRAALPPTLEVGPHTATVRSVDAHGREHTDTLVFEVVEERPQMSFRSELFAPEDAG